MLLTILGIGVVWDWLVRSEENSKEYMNSGYRSGHYFEGWDRQPIKIPHFPKAKILVLLERTQPCLAGWQRSLCTLVECARICPLACWESFSQGGISSEMLCRTAGAGSCWAFCTVGRKAWKRCRCCRSVSAGNVETRKQRLFSSCHVCWEPSTESTSVPAGKEKRFKGSS